MGTTSDPEEEGHVLCIRCSVEVSRAFVIQCEGFAIMMSCIRMRARVFKRRWEAAKMLSKRDHTRDISGKSTLFNNSVAQWRAQSVFGSPVSFVHTTVILPKR